MLLLSPAKIYELFVTTDETVRYIWVSVELGSTVMFFIFCPNKALGELFLKIQEFRAVEKYT